MMSERIPSAYCGILWRDPPCIILLDPSKTNKWPSSQPHRNASIVGIFRPAAMLCQCG